MSTGFPPAGGGLRGWARTVKRDVHALYLASFDPRVPWYAKTVAIAVAAYALSPIDLIPDFIPVLGYLDDLIIVPLGIWLAIALIPKDIMAEHRASSIEAGWDWTKRKEDKPEACTRAENSGMEK